MTMSSEHSKSSEASDELQRAREAIARHAEIVERAPWLEMIEQRFGIPGRAFDDYLIIRPNRRALHLVRRDHAPPERPQPDVIGMSFVRTRMKFPKLTTAAAMSFGHLATRNRVALSRAQADAFLSREPIELGAEQAELCTGTGYVLAGIEEVVLGVGLFRAGDDGGGRLNSLLPKAWTLADEESAFDTDLQQ